MTPTLKSEFQKLFTVRSTYVISVLALALTTFLFLYATGYNAGAEVNDPSFLSQQTLIGINFMSIFVSLIAILLVTHEYRYNLITYTLTASSSRTRVLLSKFLVITAYSVLFALVIGLLAPLMTYLGTQLKGLDLVPQTFNVLELLWKGIFVGFGNAAAAMVVAIIIRNQVGAIATLFIIINTLEGLFGSLVLKENSVYLPFTALQQVTFGTINTVEAQRAMQMTLAPTTAALVFSAYLLVGLVIAWLLFLRRDAN